MSNTKLPAQANWMERFEELLEDYAGARAEVAHFNATQQSGMKVRLPRPRLKALMDHVADRERQAGEAVAWMPIETAPKDGTVILLCAEDQLFEGKARVSQGSWSAPSETPRLKYVDGFAPEPVYDDWEPYWASYDGGFTEEHPPTHWMPLPAAPGVASPPAPQAMQAGEAVAKHSILSRATDLHEKAGMPWDEAEELALNEAGIDAAAVDELIGNCAYSGLSSLLTDEDELRQFTRAVLVHQPLASLPAPQAVQAGWKLVPVEPTEAMVGRALYANERGDIMVREVRAIYAAMLAAAPSPDGKAEQAEAPSDELLKSLESCQAALRRLSWKDDSVTHALERLQVAVRELHEKQRGQA